VRRGRISDRSDNGQAAPTLHNLHLVAWRISGGFSPSGTSQASPKISSRQDGANPQRIDMTEPGNPSRDIFVPPKFHSISWCEAHLHLHSHLHNLGLTYRSINLHRLSISMTLPYINGVAVGSHPLISRMCKGSFAKRPHPRKVPSVWVPTPVLDIFMHWRLPMSYAQLVRKCAFILAILSGRRLSDLFNLK
jgi:hypothetical protein